ncbi:VanW family protein [Faecalispora anaeroviscerum]|uniref:VanW family protein n=1 Tax=Faecalispora anaeroviscerum TaxID=2991836 RepID=UPI0024BA216F|nr:VanW family protein [Faecalispora anaeroviscerum]
MNQLTYPHQEESLTDLYSSSPKHSKNGSGRWKKIAAAAVGVLVLGAAVFAGVSYYQQQEQSKNEANLLQADTYYAGTVVEGIDLGGKTKEEAKQLLEKAQPGLLPKIDIQLTHGEKSWAISAEDLGYSFNTQEVLDEAYAYARTGSDEERLKLIDELKTTPKTYKLAATHDDTVLKQKLTEIGQAVNVSPVNATVASFDSATATFQYKDGKDGLAVDNDSLLSQVNAMINSSGTGTIEIPVKTVPFDVTQALLKSHMQKLGTYTTTSTNTADGNHNMKVASAAINGKVIEPGAVFSFNNATGDSNLPENGYRKAVAISGGKKVLEYGGGVCQVSSTLYGAAIRSNMEITSRANHMWQSSYVPLGLDATVSYPYLDFQFKNPTEYPVYIVAGMSGTKVTVTLYGYQSPDYDNIEVVSQKTSTVAQPQDQLVVDSTLKKGQKVLDRKGNAGTRASAQRIFYLNGKVVKTEALPSSYYRAIANIYKVGPGTEGTTSSTPASSTPTSSKPVSSTPSSSAPTSSASPSSAPSSSQASSSSHSSFQQNTEFSSSSGQTESSR